MVSSFPHLNSHEFSKGCESLVERFHQRRVTQNSWDSIEMTNRQEISCLQITKTLSYPIPPVTTINVSEIEPVELSSDGDEEALFPIRIPQPLITYDIILSPAYRVPVLYIYISDRQHRFPSTMTTLSEYLLSPRFEAETAAVGVMGGVSITDHPVTNRPVFFIHPCCTAQVMQACTDSRAVTAEDYLYMWIGALGKYVGLEIPLALARDTGSFDGDRPSFGVH